MQGSENAFLFLEDQNQKCFPWKGAEDSSGRPEPLVVGCGSWRRAREKEGLASRLPLTVGLKSLQPLAIADASASRDPSRQRRITLYAKRFRARAAPHRRRRITLYAKRFWRAPPPIERVDDAKAADHAPGGNAGEGASRNGTADSRALREPQIFVSRSSRP